MPVDIRVLLQNHALPGIIKLSRLLDGATPIFREFRAYYADQVDSVFDHLGQGGRYRYLYWKPFPASAIPHPRKRPGLRWYPMNGGGARYSKPKKTVTAMTLGRRRPSGKRLSVTSKLMQDTGRLRKDASESFMQPGSLIFQSRLAYAEKQFAMRSPYSVTPEDVVFLMGLTAKHITKALIGGRANARR